jgi:hypothetical protein
MEYAATIVLHEAVTKPEALAAAATALGSTVQGLGTAFAFVPIMTGGRVEVDIPKFGEAPPLAVDVYDHRSAAHATETALRLKAALESSTGWKIEHIPV